MPTVVSAAAETNARFHEVLLQEAAAYQEQFGARMPLRQQQVLRRLLDCRTPALGGALFVCPDCGLQHFRYHSCNDRHCPRCGQADADEWLAKQSAWLLPVDYFLLETTLGDAQSSRWIGRKGPALSEPVCL